MNGFYSSENDGESHLISAYFTKSPEFTDPTDPLNGTTGNTIFTINERFTSIESIQRHLENASQNAKQTKVTQPDMLANIKAQCCLPVRGRAYLCWKKTQS